MTTERAERACDSCGRPFKAKTARARFCCDTCRVRAHRAGPRRAAKSATPAPKKAAKKNAPVTTIDPGPAPRVFPTVGVLASVTALLTRVERFDTPDGAAALALAARLDEGADTGSAMASLVKELRATIAAATHDVARAADPLDEVRLKREERLQRAHGA